MEIALFLVFPVLLAAAAIFDASSMIIPNWLNALIAALFVPVALAGHMEMSAIGWNLALGAVVFAIGAGLFLLGVMGGGDVKMIAACSVWLGLPMMVPFLLYTAIAGGALAAVALVARRIAPAGVSDAGWTRWLTERKSGVPYGIAIAAGAILVWSESILGGALLKAVG
jgi:prepilin peptidase CpaA